MIVLVIMLKTVKVLLVKYSVRCVLIVLLAQICCLSLPINISFNQKDYANKDHTSTGKEMESLNCLSASQNWYGLHSIS